MQPCGFFFFLSGPCSNHLPAVSLSLLRLSLRKLKLLGLMDRAEQRLVVPVASLGEHAYASIKTVECLVFI